MKSAGMTDGQIKALEEKVLMGGIERAQQGGVEKVE